MYPNFKLANAIWKRGLTQAKLVRMAGISSESRLSRIINGYERAKPEEIQSICKVLHLSADALGLNGGSNA